MPIFTWACNKCELYWEREYDMGKNPEKTKCPECKKKCGRRYDTPTFKFIGSGFYVNDYGGNSVMHSNAKGAVDTFVEEAKEASQKRMDTGFQNYRVYTPNYEQLEKTGQIKKSTRTVEENAAKHRQTAEHIYKNSSIDPEKQNKTNVDLMTKPDKKGME